MTIERTAWIDDDGTGTTGTVINNAEKQLLYDQIDAALAALVPSPWITPAFAAGDYSSNSGTWVVEAADVETYAYVRQGKTVTLAWGVFGATVTGSPTQLRIALPAGLVSSKLIVGIYWAVDNNGAGVPAYCQVSASGTMLLLFRDTSLSTPWTPSTNGTGARGSLTFEVL